MNATPPGQPRPPSPFWQQCLARFKEEVDPVAYRAFVESVSVRLEDNRLLLVSPNSVANRWLRENLDAPLRQMSAEFFTGAGGAAPEISYQIGKGGPGGAVGKAGKNAAAPITAEPKAPRPEKQTGLRRDFVFDSLVMGGANNLAVAMGQMTAGKDKEPGNYSPLFVYGKTGLGKTHLAQAVGNLYQKNHPERRVLYITARSFMTDVVQSFRVNRPEQFKARYRTLDMLIVDDIQFIGGDRARTQEEFFFLFNALCEEGKEVVITSDKPPADIADMPARLVSRFGAGLATKVYPPEFEMRAEILRRKGAARGVSLAADVVNFVAENIKSNVRELEGALKRILAMAKFKGEAPSVELCRAALPDLLGRANAVISPDKIKEKVASFYSVKISEFNSHKRHRSIALPRHIAIYLCRQLTNMSLPEIGKEFGNRNHTTVMHSCRQIDKALAGPAADKNLANEINALTMSIKDN